MGYTNIITGFQYIDKTDNDLNHQVIDGVNNGNEFFIECSEDDICYVNCWSFQSCATMNLNCIGPCDITCVNNTSNGCNINNITGKWALSLISNNNLYNNTFFNVNAVPRTPEELSIII